MKDLDIYRLLWILGISVVGGIIGFIVKIAPTTRNKKRKECWIIAILSVLTSAFVGFVTYHIVFYFSNNINLSCAIAGIGAFSGTDILVILQAKLVELIKRKFDSI